MIRHTEDHPLKVRCPIESCKALLRNFKELILHCELHPELGILDRVPCPDDDKLNWRECTVTTGNPMLSSQHIVIYHLNSKSDYNVFIDNFKQKTGLHFGESMYDLSMNAADRQMSFTVPDILSTKRYSNNQKEQKPQTNTNKPSQSQPSSGNNTGATGNPNNGNPGGTGNSGGDENDNKNNDDKLTWSNMMKRNLKNSQQFICENKKCKEKAIMFFSKEELDTHVKSHHACPKEFCNFASMYEDALLTHILQHKSVNSDEYSCSFCGTLFVDIDQLETHISTNHNLRCFVCEKTDFTSRTSLKKHTDQCTSASLGLNDTGNNKINQPMFHLIDLLARSNNTDKNELQKIKAMAIKSQQMTATPELYLKKSKPFFKVPHFNDTQKPISILNQRLLIIPKFIPSPLKKIANYISMNRLYQELIFV
jgi:hypothetical protein